MAFKRVFDCSQSGELTYNTPARKDSRYGNELLIRFTGDTLKSAGIKPGDRCMVEVDDEENLGRIYNNTQLGWLIKPTQPGKEIYKLRIAWKPDCGFPKAARQRKLEILQSGDGEIIFEMPQEGDVV